MLVIYVLVFSGNMIVDAFIKGAKADNSIEATRQEREPENHGTAHGVDALSDNSVNPCDIGVVALKGLDQEAERPATQAEVSCTLRSHNVVTDAFFLLC